MTHRNPAGALGVIAAGLVLLVGPASGARAALTYDVTLAAGVQVNDNLHLDPQAPVVEGEAQLRQPVRETIYTVNPGLRILWGAERDRLSLRYAGEYWMFEGDEELDALWTHTIGADLSWRRWSPFFLEAREERSRVPRTQELEGEAFVDQVERNRLSVRTGLTSGYGTRSTVELAYRGALESYSTGGAAVPAASGTEPGDDELDRLERHQAEALVRHRWNPLWEGELRLAYGRVDRELIADYTELSAFVSVDQRWSERLALRYQFEWRREDDRDQAVEAADGAGSAAETPAGAQDETPLETVRDNLLLGLEIRGDLVRGGSWAVAYLDSLAGLADGDTIKTGRISAAANVRARLGSTLDVGAWHETRDYRVSGREETAWGPTLGARWLIAPGFALDLIGSWTSTAIREEGREEIDDKTARAAAGLVLLLYKQVQLEAGYGYRKNDSSDPLREYSNNVFFALLTFHFRPVEAGRLPISYARGLVAGGIPSGGTSAAGEGAAAGAVP